MSEFYRKFSETLRHADQRSDDNYVGNLREPLTSDPIGNDFPGSPLPDLDATVDVQIKSIKEPKFNIQYSVPASDSIYSLKERSLTDKTRPLGDSTEVYNTTGIKLLSGSKVVSDSRQLAELSKLQFTVMFINSVEQLKVPLTQFYWSDSVAALSTKEKRLTDELTKPDIKEKPSREYPGINDQFWHDVEKLSKKYVPNPVEFVNTLRSNYDASMDLD